jgi:hypothetical protein
LDGSGNGVAARSRRMLIGPIPKKVVRPVRRLRVFRKTDGASRTVGSQSPNRREARECLIALANKSLPCHEIAPRAARPDAGLTTMLSVGSRGRVDVLDLDRAFFMENGGAADVSWLSVPPDAPGQPFWLLLRVGVTAPVLCDFVVGIPIGDGVGEPLDHQLAYLLAADSLALGFDVSVDAESAIRIAAPTDRRPLVAALNAVSAC